VAVLGLAYKPDVDDLRESPALEIVRLLTEEGALVKAYEPYKAGAQIPGVTTALSLEEAIADAEILVLLVPHTSFRDLDPQEVAKLTLARVAVDAVNGWVTKAWESAGFLIFRLGDGKIKRGQD
jgi:UDP-N-acetyl-D-mannosaminuronate dehydrogenase